MRATYIVRFFLFYILVNTSVALRAQDPTCASSSSDAAQESVAAAASRAKSQRTLHAKKVFTDEDLPVALGPLPPLKMNEAENGEEVVAAIAEYQQTHKRDETEAVVHRWYDEYDKQLEDAIKRNLQIKAVRNANSMNAAAMCETGEDYEKCENRRIAEWRDVRYDQAEILRNNEKIVRLQHSLMNIRNRLMQMGYRYDWFKVRTTNNIDRF